MPNILIFTVVLNVVFLIKLSNPRVELVFRSFTENSKNISPPLCYLDKLCNP
jgi:hypothetical protein